MKTTMSYFVGIAMACAIVTVSCKKDDLEEAVLPQTVQDEQSVSASNSQEGSDGTDGADGAQGEQGPKGDQGEPGPAGEHGEDGAQGEQGPEGEKGDTGETGPAGTDGADGEQGPKGDQGETGAAGADGAAGEDGNANVIASEWFEPKESSYGCCNPKNKALVLATGIKSKIKEGVILVYYDNDVQVQSLPRHNVGPTGNIQKSVESHINHASNTLYVTIRKYDSDLMSREYTWNASGPAYGKGVRFRYVIIPKETSAKNDSRNFEKMSYEKLMDYFGLAY